MDPQPDPAVEILILCGRLEALDRALSIASRRGLPDGGIRQLLTATAEEINRRCRDAAQPPPPAEPRAIVACIGVYPSSDAALAVASRLWNDNINAWAARHADGAPEYAVMVRAQSWRYESAPVTP